jgi:hypothetical protein
MNKEKAIEFIKNMDDEDIISLVQEINSYNGNLDNLDYQPFDEEFFHVYFTDPYEAARATFFGDIRNWGDDYIHFNAYGNLESRDTIGLAMDCRDYADEIVDAMEDDYNQLDIPDELFDIFAEEE